MLQQGFEARGSDLSARLISYENLVLDVENLTSPVPTMVPSGGGGEASTTLPQGTTPVPPAQPTVTPSPNNFCPEEHPGML